MNNLADSHTHSSFSSDSEASPEENIIAAINNQLAAICFTDHNDFDFPPENGKSVFQLDFKNYISCLSELRDKYRDKITVYIGVEQGLCSSAAERINAYDGGHQLDFIIGSSHLVYGQDPYYPEFWEGQTPENVINDYYESILENLKTCRNFDVYGHLDYIARYIPDKSYIYYYSHFSGIIDKILKCIIELGKGIEINTAGLRTHLSSTNPCAEVIARYRRLGGEIITVGSDAHESRHIASGFNTAYEILQASGFRYYTVFKERVPKFIKL